MTLDLDDCVLVGPALTKPFLCDGLARVVELPHPTNAKWDVLRGSLRLGGAQRVHQHVTTALAGALGYGHPLRQHAVTTREGPEDGGWLLRAPGGAQLRAWSIASDTDPDAADRSPRASRGSPTRIAQRVLLSCGEAAGLLTNGEMIRLLLCDASRADSHFSVAMSDWRQRALPPDSFRVLLSLAGAGGLPRLASVLEAARLHQARVTIELRRQAQQAITGFINALPDRTGLDPAALWREGLVLLYRLLFILKLESPAEAGDGFSFASVRLWRSALSPNRALAPLVRRHLDRGHDTGRMIESGLRLLFALFQNGFSCSELLISPLGGALFGDATTPFLDRVEWGERSAAILLDQLIWTNSTYGERARVHYSSLDVEDLGSIYEGLLEQEPAIATEPMIRVRRGKLETVIAAGGACADIEPGQFYLRSGMSRKASGSFYTPHEFVRFLVRETLEAKITALSPLHDPHPAKLLTLKIVDPATGSGHFLVEACRYLGEAMLTACRICDHRGLHTRIQALPDPDNTIASYLPSRGFSEMRARAICRRLVAVHCLYGCDRNELAIELAKLSLWLESFAEGLPLTFLDHRLVRGDALTGPFFEQLLILPVTGGPLDPLLAGEVTSRLNANVSRARQLASALSASLGRDIDDLRTKQLLKDQLDRLLRPMRQLARAWAGAAMMRERDGDDLWLGLARRVVATGTWPDVLNEPEAAMLAAGEEAVAWDLVFPEVFPEGFSVVLGNPPWDVVLPNTKDFIAYYDLAMLAARTRPERIGIEQAVLAQDGIAATFDAYRARFTRLKNIAQRLYVHQRAGHGAASTAGNLDLFRLFAERNMALAAEDGSIGVLMPSAFHANEGTTGIRHLYLRQSRLKWCLSFENRRRVFPIDSRFKFDLVVAHRPGPTRSFQCGFYLERIEDTADSEKIMTYDMPFLRQTGGNNLTPLELRGNNDLCVAEKFFANPSRMGTWCSEHSIRFGCDLHMTADSHHFGHAGTGGLILHEGKTFHQYTDRWESEPRYRVAQSCLKPGLAAAVQYYRLAFRDIARSNDERTMIACIAPPGVLFGHTATVEKSPWARANADALILCALFNAFPFDWLARQKAATHLSLYILQALPVPHLDDAACRFLAHGALRLSCQHSGYTALWREQIGHQREVTVPHWILRAQIDAVIADSYNLERNDYARLLQGFSHRSFADAPSLCLMQFDAVRAEGRDVFCRRHDPYHDVALVTKTAEPAGYS